MFPAAGIPFAAPIAVCEGVPVYGSESFDKILGTLGGIADFDEAGRMLNIKQSFLFILHAYLFRISILERLHLFGGEQNSPFSSTRRSRVNETAASLSVVTVLNTQLSIKAYLNSKSRTR